MSDNASNMKKAFKVCLWDEKDTEGDDRVEEDENEEEDDADDVNDVEVDFEEVFQEQYRRPCNIHTLQLLVNDCIKLLPVRYQNILKKSKIVCAKQHRSNKLSEAMSVQLPEGCATRWNGQLALMKVIEAHFLEVQQNVGHFLHADLEPLRSLIHFFGLFYFLTKKLESEKTSTIQDVIPGLCKLERDIASCACMPTPYIESCLNCFVNRFGFVSTDMHLVSATVLSPHGLKWLKIAATKNTKLQFAQEDVIIQKVKAYTGAVIADLDLQNCPPCASQPHFAKETEDQFGYETDFPSACTWETEFDQHLLRASSLQTSLDASAYWVAQPFSQLQVAALMMLAVPASSAPVERIFSHAGLICSSKRTRMRDDLLSAFIKAKYNYLPTVSA